MSDGPTGKDGLLDLTLGVVDRPGDADGPWRTALRHYRHRSPLQLGRLLYPDPSCPDMAFVYVAMLSGGFVQGDRMTQRIVLQPGARAHVTTLAATKVYGMQRHEASQRIDLSAGAGALLEWWPDPIIPFRQARFRQEVILTADPHAVLLYGDLLLPGRAARQERHAYDAYSSRVTARRPDGRLLFADTQCLAPPPAGAPPLSSILPLERDTLGTVYVLAPHAQARSLLASLAPGLADATGSAPGRPGVTPGTPGSPAEDDGATPTCRSSAAPALGQSGVLAGCSLLPGDCGLVVRLLAPNGRTGRRAMHAVWQSVRRGLLGVDAPDVRKP